MRRIAFDEIYEDLKTKINNNTLYPGRKLSESILTARYGISRTPIREIIKRLEQEDLVEVKPKSGIYIKKRTEKKILELFQIRTYLECLAYRLALPLVGENEIANMRKILAKMGNLRRRTPFDYRKYSELHYNFHHKLVKLSGNQTLLSVFEKLHLENTYMFNSEFCDEENLRQTDADHEQIVLSFSQRDPSGENLLKQGLINFENGN